MSFVNYVNASSNFIVQAGGFALYGILGGKLVSVITGCNLTLAGGTFGAVAYLISQVTCPVFNNIFRQRGANNASKFLGDILKCATNLTAGYFITNAIVPISLTGIISATSLLVLS